jgi:hypothetical protein
MFVGLLYEGSFDDSPSREIINRVISSETVFSSNMVKYKPYPGYGQILTKMSLAKKVFFESTTPVNFAVFLSDVDKYPERKIEIPKWVRKYHLSVPTKRIVFGLPDPCFEDWLLAEGNAIKKLLSISGTESIYDQTQNPKQQIEDLYLKYNKDPTLTLKDLYLKTTKEIDLEYLSRVNPSFNQFYKDLKSLLQKLG